MLSVSDGNWHPIEIDLEDNDLLEPQKIPSPTDEKKTWSCYNVNMSIDGGEFEEHEIPFWAMKPFHEAVKEAWEANEETSLELLYKREVDGKVNTATFRGA